MFDARAILDRIFKEIINEGHLEVVDELFTTDYVDHGPLGDLVGREAFKASIAVWRAAVPDVHTEISNVIVEGDTAGWVVHGTGTHTGDQLGFPATNKRFDTYSANIGRFRDGQAVEHWSDQGMFQMLVQLGILPAPTANPG